jgi:hypothetical protein
MFFRSSTLDIEGARNVFSATMLTLFTVPAPASSAYVNLMDSGDSIDNNWVYQVDEATDRKVGKSIVSIGTQPGTAARTVPPRRDSPMLLFYPATRTRATGRMYLPRVGTSFLQGGDLHPSFAPIIKTVVQQALTYLASNHGTLVVRSRRKHSDQPVASFVLSTRLAGTSTRTATAHPTYL